MALVSKIATLSIRDVMVCRIVLNMVETRRGVVCNEMGEKGCGM